MISLLRGGVNLAVPLMPWGGSPHDARNLLPIGHLRAG